MTDRDDGLTAELLRAGFEDRLPVDDDARRRSFDAALAAFDEAVEPHRTSVVVEVDAQPGSRRPPRRGVPPFTLLSIAALAIALAGVVVVLTRGGAERVRTGVADDPVELPAPTPTAAPPSTAVPSDWSSWADAVEPADALACVSRAAFREIVAAELPPPNPAGPLPESQWALAQIRGLAGIGDALAPEVAPAASDAAARDLELLAEADVAAFADDGGPDQTFADRVAAVRTSMESNPFWQADGGGCWLDRPDDRSAIDDLRGEVGAEELVRCLAAETVDRALGWQAADLETDRTASVGAALVVLANYTSGEDPQVLGLLGELSLVRPTDPDSAASIDAARADLAGLGFGLDESRCRASGT